MNKPFYIFLFVMLFCCEAKTQTNLVYNGDFEDYSSCPNLVTQISYCNNWSSANPATPDYFNSCSASIDVSIPTNLFGHQLAMSGQAYVGIYVYSRDNYREYLQGETTTLLKKNQQYIFKFHVSCANYSDYAISKLGAYFSSTPITSSSAYNPIILTPQIINSNNFYIKDTLNWYKIEGKFISDGSEKYITIGNFTDTLNNDTLRIGNFSTNDPTAYYYIDDISLIEDEISEVIPNVFTPNGDGINDTWKLPPGLNNYEVFIYNRWGNEILKASADDFGWDGKNQNGDMCSDGTYFYIIQDTNSYSNSFKGFLQLNH